MKRIIVSTIFFFSMAGVALAQRSSKNSEGNKSSVSTTVKAKSKKQIKNASTPQTVKDSLPNNRKEYMQNGQLATYTGHQATPVNSDQYQSKKGKKKATKKKDRTRQ